jgi:hypothetical protein
MKSSSRLIKILIALCVTTLFALYLFSTPVNADMGPKPTMYFEFEFAEDTPDLLILEGILLECEDPSCVHSQLLEDFGPQGFSCFGTTCHATAYSFSDYHKLILTFSDSTTRESNIFTKKSFEANYLVTVNATELFVQEGRGYPNPSIYLLGLVIFNILLLTGAFVVLVFLTVKGIQSHRWLIAAIVISLALAISGGAITVTLPITLAIELLIATAYSLKRKYPLLPTLTLVGLANVVTQFALWVALSAISSGEALLITIGLEVIIWGAEALILYLPQRNELTFKEVALLSLIINLASFGVGLLLPI